MDHAPTLSTVRRLERGQVFECLGIVLVRAVPDVHFGLETFTTFFTVLPASRVPFVVVITTQCVAVVIAMAGIRRIRKENVLVFVDANPIAAAGRARQGFCCRATQATTTRWIG